MRNPGPRGPFASIAYGALSIVAGMMSGTFTTVLYAIGAALTGWFGTDCCDLMHPDEATILIVGGFAAPFLLSFILALYVLRPTGLGSLGPAEGFEVRALRAPLLVLANFVVFGLSVHFSEATGSYAFGPKGPAWSPIVFVAAIPAVLLLHS